jgi:hypothetical protein
VEVKKSKGKERATAIQSEPQSTPQINFQDYHFNSNESLSDNLFESAPTSDVSSTPAVTSFATTSSTIPSTSSSTQSTSTVPDAKNNNKEIKLSKKKKKKFKRRLISKRHLNNQKKRLVAPDQ